MPRVKRGFKARRRRNKVLKLAKGYRGARGKLFRSATEAVDRAASYAFRDRKVKKRDYQPEGEYPVIDQGQDPIGGFTSESGLLYEGELPVIIFGDHTLAVKYVDRPFAVGADGVKLLRPKGISDEKLNKNKIQFKIKNCI